MENASTWLTNTVALAVLVAWFVTLGVGVTRNDWTALTITTPVVLVLAGYAFGVKIIQRQKPQPGPPPVGPLENGHGHP